MTEYTEKKGTTTRVQMSCTYDSLNRPETSSYTVNGKYSYKCNCTSYPDEELKSATKAYVYASGTWGDRLTSYNGENIVYNAAGYPTTYRGSALTWSNGNLTKFGATTFSYNDAGIRIKKGTTEYFVKGSQILAEKRGSAVIHYYYDDSGVAGFEYNGQKYYYRKNLQGDILAIYDCCGNMLGEYKYDAWGNILL